MRMEKYMLGVDQSTSGTKAIIVNHQGQIIAKCAKEHRQYYQHPGWVEHDPNEIYHHVKNVIHDVLILAGMKSNQIAALTLTNQRETAMIWDQTTSEPIYNAIVWQCQRTADRCAELEELGKGPMVKAKTGLMLDPYFSASKFQWILDHVDGARQKANEGRLLAGTMDSWLIWKLTGEKVHATDYTNASRTSLYNIHELKWDQELLELFNIPLSLLPEVKSSNTVFGYTQENNLFAKSIPISGVIGDSQGALFGQLCCYSGMVKATYGTGTSVMMNTGLTPIASGNGLVTAIAWGIDGQVSYALEGIIRATGDCIRWVRDNLGLFSSYEELQQLISSSESNEGVYLVPAFAGLGAPYWDPFARAAIIGMTRGVGKAHIVRAAVESIAYQIRDVIELMEHESELKIKQLKVDGGATSNPFLMQFQADIIDTEVVHTEFPELSAMGSVYLGGLGVGFWASVEEIEKIAVKTSTYKPSMEPEVRERNYQGWKTAVSRVLIGGELK
jgi:glycerol kinase